MALFRLPFVAYLEQHTCCTDVNDARLSQNKKPADLQ